MVDETPSFLRKFAKYEWEIHKHLILGRPFGMS